MTYFTLREPETIQRKDASGKIIAERVLFFRELGYLEWKELQQRVRQRANADAMDKDAQGWLMMCETVTACVENEDGTPAYTADSLRRESQSVIHTIGKRALKSQGIDLDAVKDEPEMTEDELEGNVEPSRKSGTN